MIASVFPRFAVGDSIFLSILYGNENYTLQKIACFFSNLLSLILDFVLRNKMGGINLSFYIFNQLPILPPDAYTSSDVAFILPRVLELTYTSHALRPWAEDICPEYSGGPFPFDPDRRAVLRAELDAYYARLYGLTRDDLRYILDPHDVMGPDYPSETFRVLRDGELARFGEYRTRRLVLEAWDRLDG